MASVPKKVNQLGSAAAIATALITQPLLAGSSELLAPVVQAALASVAMRSERKDKLPTQLVLEPVGRSSIEFTGHRSHSSHSSHSSHHSGAASYSSHASHYSASAPAPPAKQPRSLPPTASARNGGSISPAARPNVIDPAQYDAEPVPQIKREPQYDLSVPGQRFDLVSVTRAVNGVVWARILDRKTGQERKVREFDAIDGYIVTNIDAGDRTLTLVDGSMKPAILSARANTK